MYFQDQEMPGWTVHPTDGKFEDAKQPKVGWSVYPYNAPSRTIRTAEAVR